MSQTPDSDDRPAGWIVPPPWLQAHDLTADEVEALKARFLATAGRPPILLPPDPPRWRRWWEWPPVQWWWYRQYKRADRRTFLRECAEIRWRGAWRPATDPPAAGADSGDRA